MLAHAGTADEFLAELMLFGGAWIGWISVSRLRGRGFPQLSRTAAKMLAAAAVAVAISAFVVPRQLLKPPTPGASRPASAATLAIIEPKQGEPVSGPTMEVAMRLTGGTIVSTSSTTLTSNTGHIHLSLDRELVSMTYGQLQNVDISHLSPGSHTLTAEFVANDHGPFNPRVTATIKFTKVG